MFKRRAVLLLSVLSFPFSVTLSGCDLHPSGPVPSYITVDSLIPGDVNGNRPPMPLPGRVIPDVSIYIDGNPAGTYDLNTLGNNVLGGKATLPFTGSHRLDVYGVVRANGLSSQRVSYPFFQPYTTTVDFGEGKMLDLTTLVLKATTGIVNPLPLSETFSDTLLDVDDGTFGQVPVKVETGTLVSDLGLFHQKRVDDPYGIVRSTYPDSAQILEIEAKVGTANSIQKQGSLYLEVDVRNNVDFTYGLYVLESGSGYVFYPTGLIKADATRWRRLYLFLGSTASQAAVGLNMRFGMQCISDTTLGTTSYLAVDNMRLLHMQ